MDLRSCQSVFLLLMISTTTTIVESKFFSASVARERLVTDLFVHYDPMVRPDALGKKIDLYVNVEPQHFQFRESDGALNFIGLLNVRWHDPKLTWNPKDYNNLNKIPISQKIVWVPDLEMYNNAPDKFFRMHRNGVVVLEHTGDLFWSDSIDMTMFCTTNFRDWPHDQHYCSMNLGSWTYSGFDIDMHKDNINNSMNFDSLSMHNTLFSVTNFTAEHVETIYPCCDEPYVTIQYHMTFKRLSSYVVLFRAPALCVILLTLLALTLESRRGMEKIWLNGTSLLLIVLNLIYFATKVGQFARKTPLIVVFFSCSLVLVTIAHLISIFSLLATRSRFRGKLPHRISCFLKSSFVHWIAPTQKINSKHGHTEINSQFEDVKLQENSNLLSVELNPNEWTHLAKVVERFSLLSFSVIFFILGTTCFV